VYVNDEGIITISQSQLLNNFAFEGINLYFINSKEKSRFESSNVTSFEAMDQTLMEHMLVGKDEEFKVLSRALFNQFDFTSEVEFALQSSALTLVG